MQARVAKVLEIELVSDLDGRRLRRLNSIVNRYRLERRALSSTGTAERYTSRDQVAVSLYGPDVVLDNVKRQMRRLEAVLEAAGLLEVRVLRGDQGEDRGLVIRLLDPLVELEDASAVDGLGAELVLKRRPETRKEARERRHAPYCRQQSDRKRCGGVPGLYVRRRDGLGARNTSSIEIAPPGSRLGGVYGTTSLPHPTARKSERDASARLRHRGGRAALEKRATASADANEPDGRLTPPSADAARSSGGGAALEARRSTQNGRRDREGGEGANRWAALDRLRKIALREGGAERLREEGRRGAPPCSIGVAIFEATFVADTPSSWFALRAGSTNRYDDAVDEAGQAIKYVPINQRWAQRLEVACRQIDRLEGAGAGIAALVDDVTRWQPSDGAARGARHDRRDVAPGDVTRHQFDPGWPVSLAYFIRRLQMRARALRRGQDPRRRLRSVDWRIRQERREITRWGSLGDLNAELAYFRRLDELDADDAAELERLERRAEDLAGLEALGLEEGELPY